MKKNHLRMLALAMAAMMSLTACGAVQPQKHQELQRGQQPEHV